MAAIVHKMTLICLSKIYHAILQTVKFWKNFHWLNWKEDCPKENIKEKKMFLFYL